MLITTAEIVNGLLRDKGSVLQILSNFMLKFPELLSKILPITSLLATLFSLNKLKTHSELIAILAAGFSPKKIYLLIFSLSTFVALLQFYNVSYFEPLANEVNIKKSIHPYSVP